MSALVADTHALIWYVLNAPELSATARAAMEFASQEGKLIYVASISLVEITYLIEKGRLPLVLLNRVMDAMADEQSALVLVPLDEAAVRAVGRIPRNKVPDMPDRIIAATALHLNLPLITRDRQIQASGIQTIW
jgi:PIN domain nuclease of toxin-antitoxin system